MDMGAVYGRHWVGYRCVLWEYTSRLLFFFFFSFQHTPVLELCVWI